MAGLQSSTPPDGGSPQESASEARVIDGEGIFDLEAVGWLFDWAMACPEGSFVVFWEDDPGNPERCTCSDFERVVHQIEDGRILQDVIRSNGDPYGDAELDEKVRRLIDSRAAALVGAASVSVRVPPGKFLAIYCAACDDATFTIPDADKKLMNLLVERGIDVRLVSQHRPEETGDATS